MRGLALSGGAAFGAYQVGVYRALSERGWRPDVTTGISIGAVNAWLMARAIGQEELEAVWLRWPAELLPGRERKIDLPWRVQIPMFRAWIARIAAEFADRPLVCDGRVTFLELGGKVQTISVGEADGDDLLAACALPGVMAPVRTRHGVCLDYGIVRYIPMEETVEAGADEIVLVDLLAAHPFPSVRRVRRAALRLRDRIAGRPPVPPAAERPGVDVTVVAHASPLGGVLESFRWKRELVERLIADGYRDAAAAFDGRRQRTIPAPVHSMNPSPVSVAPQ